MSHESEMQELLEALDQAGLRARLWFCPVSEHGRRPGITVQWDGGVARCTQDGCPHTSEGVPMSFEQEQIRQRLISRRVELGLTQSELAARMGTSQSAVSDFETGRHIPRVNTLRRWAQALNMRISIQLEEQ